MIEIKIDEAKLGVEQKHFRGHMNSGSIKNRLGAGGFKTKLLDACLKSDFSNRVKLLRGFPELVKCVSEYQGNWTGVKKRAESEGLVIEDIETSQGWWRE